MRSIHKIQKVQTLKDTIANLVFKIAEKKGWNDYSLKEAGVVSGYGEGIAFLLFPNGIYEVIECFISFIEKQVVEKYIALDSYKGKLGIKDAILQYCSIQFQVLSEYKASISRLISFFMLPWNMGRGIKLMWCIVDNIWYDVLNDRSVDFNFYTKRSLLFAALCGAALFWVSDKSNNSIDTIDFLSGELDSIMKMGRFIRKVI